jgi:hypothetical protein
MPANAPPSDLTRPNPALSRMVLAVFTIAIAIGTAACRTDDIPGPPDCAVPDQLRRISIQPSEVTVAVGRTTALVAYRIGPTGPYVSCPPPMTWLIANTAIATLEAEGVVRASRPARPTYLCGVEASRTARRSLSRRRPGGPPSSSAELDSLKRHTPSTETTSGALSETSP